MSVEQTAWAAIGLLTVFVIGMVPVFLIELRAIGGRLDRLDEKMERGFERVDQRFEWNERRFERMDRRFDRLDAKIDAANAKLDDHIKRPTG